MRGTTLLTLEKEPVTGILIMMNWWFINRRDLLGFKYFAYPETSRNIAYPEKRDPKSFRIGYLEGHPKIKSGEKTIVSSPMLWDWMGFKREISMDLVQGGAPNIAN